MATSAAKFLWYELLTNDAGASETFYRRVMGWEAKDSGLPGPPYTIVSAGGVPVGGIATIQKDACEAASRPAWAGYVGVDDVDAVVARLETLGGKVLGPARDIPGVLRFAVVADPWGAVFLLLRGFSPEPLPSAAPGAPGTVGWNELCAGDGPKAFDFYSALFGWTKAGAVDMGAMGIYQTFAAGGPAVGGMMTKPPEAPGVGWLHYFNVASAEATIALAKENGAKLLMGPHEVPGGSWIAHLLDPQGATLAIVGAKK
jgi:uncharacterized protein